MGASAPFAAGTSTSAGGAGSIAGASGGGVTLGTALGTPGTDLASVLQQLTDTMKTLQDTIAGAFGLGGGSLGGGPAQTSPTQTSPAQTAPTQAPPTAASPAQEPAQAPAPAAEEPAPTTPAQAAAPDPAPTKPKTYTVAAGDTLSSIAQANGVDTGALYRRNAKVIGPDPNVIQVGQVLELPAPGKTSPLPPTPSSSTAGQSGGSTTTQTSPSQSTPSQSTSTSTGAAGGPDETGSTDPKAAQRAALQTQLEAAQAAYDALPQETRRSTTPEGMAQMRENHAALEQELAAAKQALNNAAEDNDGSPEGIANEERYRSEVASLEQRYVSLGNLIQLSQEINDRNAALAAAQAEIDRVKDEIVALG